MAFMEGIVNYFYENPGWIIVAVLLYVFVYVLSRFFSTPKPGPNPFKFDCAEKAPALEDVVLDQAKRDKVLKQGFTLKKIPERIDAIVIGSGIGGLTVANILAKVGRRVLVLEQHDQAGGCCHTFIEKGFEFDVGIHYIGEMRNNTVSRLLVNQMTEGRLVWEDLRDEFDVCAIGPPGKQKLYPFKAGSYETWTASIVKMFPDEEKAIGKFMNMVKDVRKSIMGQMMLKFMSKSYGRFLINTGLIHRVTDYFKFSNVSLGEVLDGLTENKDLKTVLSYSFGDYGSLPRDGSFAMHAALWNHYIFGASYPRGGASEFAFTMIPVIERAGGRVLVRAPVTQIIAENGRAVGVKVRKSEHGDEIEIRAPLIISDAGVMNTFTKLLPQEASKKSSIPKMITSKQVKSGIGCMSVFVGLNGTAEELKLTGQNFWAYTTNDIDNYMDDYTSKTLEEVADADVPLLFISFPSGKDPTFNMKYPGKTACTIVALAKYEWFASWANNRVKKRGEEYEALKMKMGQRIWQQACTLLPQLEDKVEYFEVASPASNKYYLNSPNGEIYGLDHDKKRFGSPAVVMNLRPDTDIPGLLITGQDVMSAGLMGAMFGGVLCASRILHRNIYEDLIKLRKQVNKQK